MSLAKWERDSAFMRSARLLWPDDAVLATRYSPERGRAAARRRMAHRYEGWSMLRTLAQLEADAREAAAQLRS